MKKALVVLVFLFPRFLGATPPLFVSLGAYCEVANTLRMNKLRNLAFPLDWVVSAKHSGLISLLEEDFAFFTEPSYFVSLSYPPTSVKNAYYDLLFHHDWPFVDQIQSEKRFKEQLEAMQSKYARRIARFRQLRAYEGKVIFIRCPSWEEGNPDENREQALELKQTLDAYFPALDFLLVIVNYLDTNTYPNRQIFPLPIGEMENVVEYKIERNNHEEKFRQIYQELLQVQE